MPFQTGDHRTIVMTMKTTSAAFANRSAARLAAGVAVASSIGLLLAATIMGWLTYGTTILFTLAQGGMAWCF